jgi:hypothetical protein
MDRAFACANAAISWHQVNQPESDHTHGLHLQADPRAGVEQTRDANRFWPTASAAQQQQQQRQQQWSPRGEGPSTTSTTSTTTTAHSLDSDPGHDEAAAAASVLPQGTQGIKETRAAIDPKAKEKEKEKEKEKKKEDGGPGELYGDKQFGPLRLSELNGFTQYTAVHLLWVFSAYHFHERSLWSSEDFLLEAQEEERQISELASALSHIQTFPFERYVIRWSPLTLSLSFSLLDTRTYHPLFVSTTW